MADLVTHLCTGLLVGLPLGRSRAACLALGAVLPDLASRVPVIAMEWAVRALDWPIPAAVRHAFGVGHMPLGALLVAGLAALAFERGQRTRAWGWLSGGVALHLGLDVLQDHHGMGYRLLFPLNTTRYELGWIGSEATVPGAIPLLLWTVLSWMAWTRWTRAHEARRGAARTDED